MQPTGNWAAADPGVRVFNPPPFPEYYNSRSVIKLSITHVVVAALHITFGIACIFTVPHWTSLVAFPIWGGVVFCVAGGLGIGSYKNQSKAVISIMLKVWFAILTNIIRTKNYRPLIFIRRQRWQYHSEGDGHPCVHKIGTFLGFSCFSVLIATVMFVFYIFPFIHFSNNQYRYSWGYDGYRYAGGQTINSSLKRNSI